MEPEGVLTGDIHCHALFYYYLHARKTYETYVLNTPIVYEGTKDPEYNLEQLFKSTASLYGVDPTNMAGWWPLVDKQCLLMGLPLMPEGWKYSFHSASFVPIGMN